MLAWVLQSIPVACGGTLYQYPLLNNLQRMVLCRVAFLLVLVLRHRNTELVLLQLGTINNHAPTLNHLKEANGPDILLITPDRKTCPIHRRLLDTLILCPSEVPLAFNRGGMNTLADERFNV